MLGVRGDFAERVQGAADAVKKVWCRFPIPSSAILLEIAEI
jgi:hypothetical protein